MYDLVSLGRNARTASNSLKTTTTAQRNKALALIAKELLSSTRQIIAANELDLANAKTGGMKSAMLDRLTLNQNRIEDIAKAIEEVIDLADPVGVVEKGETRPNGLLILKTRVPIGVVAMIYEARPNVTVDAAVLCIKSGNACILRGGSEAFSSNRVLVSIMQRALGAAGLDPNSVQLVEDTSRDTATRLMKLNEYVDVLIPRGGAGLIKSVVENATVPTIETGAGNCHIYVDASANLAMAVSVIDNAKTSRPSVCNAVETILIHKNIAIELLPRLKKQLDLHNVDLRGCPATLKILPSITAATETDYATEYDDYILAIKVVDSLDEAVKHIAEYSTGHSESIITESYSASQEFIARVDSAAVYVNASTRFTDGGEFGLGAEVGISTQRLHARGPMGLRDLTTAKYIITGNGQVR